MFLPWKLGLQSPNFTGDEGVEDQEDWRTKNGLVLYTFSPLSLPVKGVHGKSWLGRGTIGEREATVCEGCTHFCLCIHIQVCVR